jgi:biotin transport system substrate-specific component
VPFWPVPMTMQTFVVLGIGAAYGARLAGVTVATYLAQGAMGLPVFSAGGGLAYLAGPTGGYLLGFLAAAVVSVAIWPTAASAAPGSRPWRPSSPARPSSSPWASPGSPSSSAFQTALSAGVVPFLTSEAVKIALAVAVFPMAWKLADRQG